MKLLKIGLIMLLLVTLGSPVPGQGSDKQGEPEKNAAGLSEPQKVVWGLFCGVYCLAGV